MQTRHELVEQFIQLRHKRGMTQKRVEELSGVPQQQISVVEREQAEPRIDTLLALAAALRARIVLVPAEDAGTAGGLFAGLEDMPNRTGVDDLIVRDLEEDED